MKITILGGGLSALAAAYSLCKGHDITILEKSSELGGLASSFEYNNKYIPSFYHHVFFQDKITKSFLKKFDLKINFKKIKMGIIAKNKIYSFTSPSQLLKFDYLSFPARIRYGLFGIYSLFFMNPNKIPDDLDAQSWLEKYAGKEATKKIFYNLYGFNKFGIPLNKVAAKKLASRLKEREAIGNFGYPELGLNSLIDSFEKYLLKNNVKIIKKAKIKKLDNKIIHYNNKKLKSDIIINTIPVPEFLKIAKIPEDYRNKLSKIKYCPNITVTFATDKFLSNYYWLNVLDEDVHIIMQHSLIFDKYNNKINWASKYGGSEKDFKLTDEQIKKKYLSIVKKYFPNVKILWSKVSREKYASPTYDTDYYKNKPDYTTQSSWLYNAGVAVTFPKIRNMNTALESGLKVASVIKKFSKSN